MDITIALVCTLWASGQPLSQAYTARESSRTPLRSTEQHCTHWHAYRKYTESLRNTYASIIWTRSGSPMMSTIEKFTVWNSLSLVPRPRPAFSCLQYGKAGRARYISWRNQQVAKKSRLICRIIFFMMEKKKKKVAKNCRTGCVSRIFQPTTRSTLSV